MLSAFSADNTDIHDRLDFSTSTWPVWDDDGDALSDPVEVDDSHPEASVATWTYQPSTGLLTRKECADGNATFYDGLE